jgi:glycosyltransferase involved in cell wall biosynthesis
LKVAIITQFPKNPAFPRGGVESVSVNLIKALAAYNDLDIHVITQDTACLLPDIFSWEGTTVHRLPRHNQKAMLNAIGQGRRQISDYLIKLAPDVVHAHDTYGLMVKGLKIPRVFTIHGFIYADTLVSKTRFAKLRSILWYLVETKGWEDQPNIISISPYVRERLRGKTEAVIYDIDNPISEDFFKCPRSERKGVIFSAAVISRRKNTLRLIEAFQKLINDGCNAELRLAGPVIEKEYGKLVYDFIEKHQLTGKVTLLGQIGRSEIMRELSSTSVFALVALEEGAPMGIAEAMAVGIPIIASNRCGMPYMIQHRESGFLVDPMCVDDIVRRMRLLLGDEKVRKKMGEQARLTAIQRFHPVHVALRTRDVYYELIGNNTTILLEGLSEACDV